MQLLSTVCYSSSKYQLWTKGSHMLDTFLLGRTFISLLSFRFWYLARFSYHLSSMPNWKSISWLLSSMFAILIRLMEMLTLTGTIILLLRRIKLVVGGIFMLYPCRNMISSQPVSSDWSEQSGTWSHLCNMGMQSPLWQVNSSSMQPVSFRSLV